MVKRSPKRYTTPPSSPQRTKACRKRVQGFLNGLKRNSPSAFRNKKTRQRRRNEYLSRQRSSSSSPCYTPRGSTKRQASLVVRRRSARRTPSAKQRNYIDGLVRFWKDGKRSDPSYSYKQAMIDYSKSRR
jgi:hypothetical protein